MDQELFKARCSECNLTFFGSLQTMEKDFEFPDAWVFASGSLAETMKLHHKDCHKGHPRPLIGLKKGDHPSKCRISYVSNSTGAEIGTLQSAIFHSLFWFSKRLEPDEFVRILDN